MTVVLPLPRPEGGLRVLAIGAHSDDIEIGCGGTILSLLRERGDVTVDWVVLSAAGAREEEARAAAARVLAGAREARVHIHAFRDGFFPYSGGAVKEAFEALKSVDPHLVLTHTLDDRHQDHRHVAELTWNTFRSHLVLEYEIPKYDGGVFEPNVFVPLTKEVAESKVEILMDEFSTQRSKRWFSPETFLGLMRLRGIENAAQEGFAEAFVGRKVVLELAVARPSPTS